MPTLVAHSHLLITGGAGAIGSHLADAWIAGGGTVTVLDDLSNGSAANLAGALGGGRGYLVTGSVLDAALVEDCVERCDGVAHLAAVVGVGRVLAAPARTLEVGTRGGELVLQAAARRGRPVLIVSSSEVYGLCDRLPFREDEPLALGSPERPRWTYAVSKLHSESLALALWRERGLPTTVARLFNTSGPRQSAASGMVLPRFVAAALRGEVLRVHGDGTQSRVFCHVRDVVRALVGLLTTPAANGRVFNVGGEEEVTIAALAERVRSRLGSASKIVFEPHGFSRGEGYEDTTRRVPDLGRIHALFAWRTEQNLDSLIDDVARGLASDGRAVAAPMGTP